MKCKNREHMPSQLTEILSKRIKLAKQIAIGSSCHDTKYLFQIYVKSDTLTMQTTALKHPITSYNAICHLLTLLVSRRHHQQVFLKMPSIICLDHQWFKLLDCTAQTCFKRNQNLLFLYF